VGGKHYAVTCFRFAAESETVVQQATELALKWRSPGKGTSNGGQCERCSSET